MKSYKARIERLSERIPLPMSETVTPEMVAKAVRGLIERCKRIFENIGVDMPATVSYIARRCYEIRFGCSRLDFRPYDQKAEENCYVEQGIRPEQSRAFFTALAMKAAREASI